jgi:nucleoid-associated protein YgaU
MKVKRNREIVVGLSVLLALTVILVAVTVWRFTRPSTRPDTTIAQLEEPRGDTHGKEVETRRPTFADPAPTPVAVPDSSSGHTESNPWVGHMQEHPEEQPIHKLESGLKPVDVAAPPSLVAQKPHDADRYHPAAGEPAILSPDEADDRYAIPPTKRAETAAARPMVIQVSGDSPTASYGAPRGEGAQHGEGMSRSEVAQPRDYSGAGRGDADAAANRRPAAVSLPPNEMPSTAPNYGAPINAAPPTSPSYERPNYAAQNSAARDPRYGYEQTAASPPAENGASGYPGPGYARADVPHREEFQQTMPQNPLRSDGMYEVLPNDSYWTISQRVYGSGAYFRALAEVNRGKAARPDRLTPGMLISTPPVAQLEKDYPDLCPRPNRREAVRNRAAATASLASYTGGRVYVVQEGDTLWTIARLELGKVSRWAEIVQLNREALGKDYDYLTPGMKLVLPPTEGQSADRTARRNDVAPPYNR